MSIIAYAYEADYHCVDCTRNRFNPHSLWVYRVDSEGNPIHILFTTEDEYLICGDCHEIIKPYTGEGEAIA